MSERSSVFALMEAIGAFESSMNLPECIRQDLIALSDKCDDYIGMGFTYIVKVDESGNIDYQEIALI